MRFIALFALCFVLGGICRAQDESFRPLFNGKDLDGWVRINTAESTWSVRDGMLVCTGKPIGELRTERMYQNFILEVEWRHMKPRGNAGIFVWADDITARGVPFHRGIEVQVLENAYGNTRSHTTHGDIFPIHGATMTPINGRGGSRAFPSENRSKPSPEWNHYRIECRDGNISLAVNGKLVTRGTDCSPRRGYICVESEGGIVHYRNMRILELPDTPVEDEQIAKQDRGYRCLYNGIDLEAWRSNGPWQPKDWTLNFDSEQPGEIATTETFADLGFLFDFRSSEQEPGLHFHVGDVGVDMNEAAVRDHLRKPSDWNRVEGEIRGNALVLIVNGQRLPDRTITGNQSPQSLRFVAKQAMDLANIYVRALDEKPAAE